MPIQRRINAGYIENEPLSIALNLRERVERTKRRSEDNGPENVSEVPYYGQCRKIPYLCSLLPTAVRQTLSHLKVRNEIGQNKYPAP